MKICLYKSLRVSIVLLFNQGMLLLDSNHFLTSRNVSLYDEFHYGAI